MQDRLSVGLPRLGRTVAGDQDDDVNGAGVDVAVAVAVAGRELPGEAPDRVVDDLRVEGAGGEDQPVAKVGGPLRRDGSPDRAGVSAKVGDENAVVRQGRRQVDPALGQVERGDEIGGQGVRTWRPRLEMVATASFMLSATSGQEKNMPG
jgi:hypothetical protein